MSINRIKNRISEAATEACGYSPLTKVVSEEEINRILEQESGWIPCSKRLPAPETEVLITARRKYKSGGCVDIITTALYEDGNMLECDSCWDWVDIDGEYDEENDCYIIPEGWWECRHFNADDVYNNLIDCEVIAWMPLPEPYMESEEVMIECIRTAARDSKTERIKVSCLDIIVTMKGKKPYYEIKYKEIGEDYYHVGYSSYKLENVLAWKDECFEIVKECRPQTNADRIRSMTDEELLDFLCSIETYEQGSVKTIEGGVAMCSVTEVEQWLKAESEG